MKEQTAITTAKAIEQGFAGTGVSIGLYAMIAQHKDLIIALMSIASFGLAFIGFLVSTALTWYFKSKRLKLIEDQIKSGKYNASSISDE